MKTVLGPILFTSCMRAGNDVRGSEKPLLVRIAHAKWANSLLLYNQLHIPIQPYFKGREFIGFHQYFLITRSFSYSLWQWWWTICICALPVRVFAFLCSVFEGCLMCCLMCIAQNLSYKFHTRHLFPTEQCKIEKPVVTCALKLPEFSPKCWPWACLF